MLFCINNIVVLPFHDFQSLSIAFKTFLSSKKDKLYKQASSVVFMAEENKTPKEAEAEQSAGEAKVKKKAKEIEETGK